MTITTKIGVKLIALAAALILVIGALLVSCSQSDASLQEGAPEWASEITLSEWTVAVIDEFNEGDYQAIAGKIVDGDVTAEDLKNQSQDALNQLGTFEAFGETQYYTGESLGRPYSCVIQEATYENGTAEFRINFFEDGKLGGFYFLPQLDSDKSSQTTPESAS